MEIRFRETIAVDSESDDVNWGENDVKVVEENVVEEVPDDGIGVKGAMQTVKGDASTPHTAHGDTVV